MHEPGQADAANPSLLLVDDDQFVLNSLKRVLRKRSFRVHTALDGAGALRLLREHPVDLVISDSHMPNMDGATLFAQVQEHWPDCVRILLTGYVDINAAIKAINEGRIHRYTQLGRPDYCVGRQNDSLLGCNRTVTCARSHRCWC